MFIKPLVFAPRAFLCLTNAAIFVTIVIMESLTTIVYPYYRDNGYVYLHIPTRLIKQCGITSGVRFVAFAKNNKAVLEQEEKKNE